MRFFKASSAGNAFLVVAGASARRPPGALSGLAATLCRLDLGIGADGVVFLRRQRGQVLFRIFNRDGSEAELSGNGLASAAAFLLAPGKATSVTLATRVGSRQVELLSRDRRSVNLRVEIGPPDFADRRFFPFLPAASLPLNWQGIEFFPVAVGNPHAVIFCEGDEAGWEKEAGRLAQAPIFPFGVNVEVVTRVAPGLARVLFWERGVGRTPASSTGSAAAFAVLRDRGLMGPQARLECEGGAVALSERFGQIEIEVTTRILARGDFLE